MDVQERDRTAWFALTDGNAVLNDHADNAGLCAVCGSAWPCLSTRLAGALR